MVQKAETSDADDRAVDVNASDIPPGVRQAVLELMNPGDTLWRCPRAKGGKGLFNLRPQRVVVEWWLVDQHGGLIEAFWEI